MATTPTRRKKRLGRLLEQVRGSAGRSLVDAGTLLRVHESSVSRYETGHIRPNWATLHALLDFYGAPDTVRAEAAALWEAAGDGGVTVVIPPGSSRPLREFLRAEEEAETERTVELQLVPGLLQTPDYALAVGSAGRQFHKASTRPERYVSARLSRQARMAGARPIQLHAVLDEAVLRRAVGGPAVMAGQLRHLITASRWDSVTLQVIPFEAGGYGAMSSGFTIVGYADPEDPPAVYVEYTGGGAWTDDHDDVGRFEELFKEIADLALTPARSRELIKSRARGLERGGPGGS